MPHAALGGVTLLITGDPAQLAPVSPNGVAIWAHEASCWPPPARVMALTEPVRQAAGSPFAPSWRACGWDKRRRSTSTGSTRRSGKPTTSTRAPPQLTIAPSNRKCAAVNERHLATITHPLYEVHAAHGCLALLSTLPWKTTPIDPKKLKSKLTYPSAVPEVFSCKLGCRVRCTKNIYGGKYPNRELEVANGQLGTVRAIDETHDGPRILVAWDPLGGETEPTFTYMQRALYARRQAERTRSGFVVFATTRQFPLALAAAITFHGAQGATIGSRLHVDLNAVTKESQQGPWLPTPAAIYTALSRATDIANLSVASPLRLHQIRVNAHVLRFFGLVA